MRNSAAIAMILAATGCVAGEGEEIESFTFDQSLPQQQDGKSDVQCGDSTCEPSLCGYDCTVAGEQATSDCADVDGRSKTFVAASIGGAASGSFDSRSNPYEPYLALDNVLVYGCELWDYSNGSYDGFQIQYEELIHSSFTVNPNDPTRTGKHFAMYMAPFAGPGSYRAQAQYRSSHEQAWFAQQDACSVDVAVDTAGTVSGSYDCSIKSQAGGVATVRGTFGCAKNSMRPIFSKWAAAPR